MEHHNHMGGISYFPENPLLELELILYSSFLNEPTYYNPKTDTTLSYKTEEQEKLKNFILFPNYGEKSRQRIFFETAVKAYDYDFKGTLELAKKGRIEFLMRKSPCELLSIGASHSKRVQFNKENPLCFRNIVKEVCLLPTDMVSILDSWKSLKGSKTSFPTFLKKTFSDILIHLKPYHLNKYRRACIDMVRLCHPPKTKLLDELMSTGRIEMEEKDIKWESLMVEYKCWIKTLDLLEWKLPHMAALRNIRGFAIKVKDEELLKKYCSMLEGGVLQGKQFPFRYIIAYESVLNETKISYNKRTKKVYKKKGISKTSFTIIKDCLERCIQLSIENHPKLEGNTMILTDNSGSAWRTFTSSYGEQTIAEIGNISALITALSCSGQGTIGLFGDKLIEYRVDKNLSFLDNYKNIKEIIGCKGENVGLNTENGIWLFFKRAMTSSYPYHNLFFYSDQQAGHGGLYGCDPDMDDNWVLKNINGCQKFIHIPKLIQEYRKFLPHKLNVFSIQTAGYNDSILPQSTYRGANLSSWTGREVFYAEKLIELWNKIDTI